MATAEGRTLVRAALLGVVFGAAAPRMGWHSALWLAPPGLVLVVFSLLVGEPRPGEVVERDYG